MKTRIALIFIITFNLLYANKIDTITITPKNLKIANVKDGESKYLVYYKKSKEAPISDVQLWDIDIRREDYNGKKASIT